MAIGRETGKCAEKRKKVGRCAGKLKKVGGALRYILIGTLELAKLAREADNSCLSICKMNLGGL